MQVLLRVGNGGRWGVWEVKRFDFEKLYACKFFKNFYINLLDPTPHGSKKWRGNGGGRYIEHGKSGWIP